MSLQPCRTRLLCRSRASHQIPVKAASRAYSTETTSSSTTPELFTIPPESQADASPHAVPRWKQTPPAMKAPVPMDFAKDPANKIWAVNNDPQVLDDMYDRLLGPGGSRMLPEEVRWLAVTHKSFDQGRRGFNDRLALMGRLTIILEATKDVISRPPLPEAAPAADPFGREPFQSEQMASIDNLTVQGPKDVAPREKLYALANNVGLVDAMRWKPRLTSDLEASGIEMVANGAIFAIVGAVVLQHGQAVGAKVVRERILAKLSKL